MLNRSSINQALKGKDGCLSLQELEKLAEDSSIQSPHLAGCPRCQTELALLKAFESSEPLPDEGAAVAWISKRLDQRLDEVKHGTPSPAVRGSAARAPREDEGWFSRFFRGPGMRWMVPVSVALVIAVLGIGFLRRPQEPQLNADAGNGPAVYRSQEIQVIAPSGEVAEAPKTLQWKPFAGTARYKVSVMEVDEVPLWSGETRDSNLTIPISTRARMLPGKPVLWQVTALDVQGRVLATSQVQRFSVRLKSSGSTSSKSASGEISR
jgi:hypothetical protein